jgi:hypothetical protein
LYNLIIAAALVVAFFVYVYERSQRDHAKERATWQAERKELLDRIMAGDYRVLVNARLAEADAAKPPEPKPESPWEPA